MTPHERSAEDRRLDAKRDALARCFIVGALLICIAVWFISQARGH